VLTEVARVVGAGFKEIALTGVHLGSYGRDLTPHSSLVELLHAVAPPHVKRRGPRDAGQSSPVETEPDVLFRISSLEPMDCTPGIVDLVQTNDRLAPHFHLPLQHASDRILAAMRRPYTIAQYAALVSDIRARIPHASIGSDVIVGFPGETDHDFDQLASFLEGSPLTHVHVFPYSDRPGTLASGMSGKVHGAVVRERAALVRAISARLTEAFHGSQVGTSHRALTLEDGSLALTGNYLKVRIPPGRPRNKWINVKIAKAETMLVGEVLA
jgi:threonylcarbamoyladenosine tRNA methylthiotransferase MtaB